MAQLKEGIVSKNRVLVEFEDQYGDVRVIHRKKGSRLSVKRLGDTPVHALNRAAAVLIGYKIREVRTRKSMSLADLCIKAGLASATPKQRMHEIEVGKRQEGMRLGTLFAIALALEVDVSSLLPRSAEVAEKAGVVPDTTTSLKVRAA
jgi:DNA-binding Xre family transcriptional regulator